MSTTKKKDSNNPEPSTKLSNWKTFRIKRFYEGFGSCKSVLMGDYLIILAHDSTLDPTRDDRKDPNEYKPENPEPAVLLVVDLQDGHVQEEDIEDLNYHKNYTFTKYGENRIIKLGGQDNNSFDNEEIDEITIESFTPLRFRYDRIYTTWPLPGSERTTQIYHDDIYTYDGDTILNHNFIDGNQWDEVETSGEEPDSLMAPGSFLIEDDMYFYGRPSNPKAERAIFVLNLTSLTWKKLDQTSEIAKQLDWSEKNVAGDLYQGNFLTLRQGTDPNSDSICCWNIASNTWSTYKAPKNKPLAKNSNLVVYKHLLVTTVVTGDQLFVSTFDLSNFDFSISKSSEQERISSLFMCEKESDIKFRIQDKIIPAHKQVLIDKSVFFTNLFNSGMIESKQEIIDIKDCEYTVFQEYLRFLYSDKIELNVALAIKLIPFANKYLQNDLKEKCMDFLLFNINSNNVYTILDFARTEENPYLKKHCLKFFENDINPSNVLGIIKYLDENPNSEFAKENLELANEAFSIVLDSYIRILQHEKKNMKLYEGFLIKNLDMETLPALTNLICDERYHQSPEDYAFTKEGHQLYDRGSTQLQRHIIDFAYENFEILKKEKVLESLNPKFLASLWSYEMKERKKYQDIAQENTMIEEKEQSKEVNKPKNARKRREPSNSEKKASEKNPLLKQTKKDSPGK